MIEIIKTGETQGAPKEPEYVPIEKNERYYQEIQEYLGLENIGQAKLFDLLESEFGQMGEWGSKVMTYLRSLLSRNKRHLSYVQKPDLELFRKVLKDSSDLLDMEIS